MPRPSITSRDANGRAERSLDTVEQDTKAAKLRAGGATYAQIGEMLAIDPSTAYRSVQRALTNTPVEAVDELRRIEIERLDAMLRALWPAAMTGKETAVDRCLAISNQRAKLLGLEAPTRTEMTVLTRDATEQAIATLEAQLAENDSQTGSHSPA